MGFWTLSNNSRWDADTPKPERRQTRNDLIGFRTSSRPNHENKKDREDARREVRKDRRAAAKAEGSSLCSAILLASSLSAAGLASNVAKLKGWA